MKKIVFLFFSAFLIGGCIGHDFDNESQYKNEQVEANVKTVFGTSFDKNHDWCTTSNGKVTVTDIPSDVTNVKVLAHVYINDSTTTLLTLNDISINGETSVSLQYDIPSNNNGIYVSSGKVFKEVKGSTVSLSNDKLNKYAAPRKLRAAPNSPIITSMIESYANIRGWVDGEMLYSMDDNDYLNEAVSVNDYSDEYKGIFRTVIFSHFQNGKQYNNLPLIEESGYYNDNVYIVTTNETSIVVSPVYKSDKAKTYGNEVYNSDLYYYYYNESNLNSYVSNGGNEVEYLENLPKFKAVIFKQHFGETEDDNIEKRTSYKLIYWGDDKPTIGTQGSYYFPSGYKIGFMVRAKTTHDGGKKQGELYGDGRLNNHINAWGNFKSSKLGQDGPRMGWINLNDKMFLCCESGTDSDFNDIIIEVEGGIKEINFVPEFERNTYTFCFEDRELGDYDMNDVVIKAVRIDNNTVEYSIVACGANDRLYVMNIEGHTIHKFMEIHAMFGEEPSTFINTVKGDKYFEPIVERITVDKNFSFLNPNTQPYLYDETTNKNVYLSKVGEDPHGIMIPYDFKYPLERVCIKNAYEKFNEWGVNRISSTNWYKYFKDNLVY